MDKHNKKQAGKTFPKFTPYENLDKIGEIAVYYGFVPEKILPISKEDLKETGR